MSSIKGHKRRAVLAAVAPLLLLSGLTWLVPQASAVTVAPGEPVDGLRGFATGMTAFVGALNTEELSLVDAKTAWSGASVDADANGLTGTQTAEINQQWQDDRGGKLSFARGAGLELGVGTTPVDPDQLQLTGLAEADAPPPSTANEEIELSELDPLAYASLLEGNAVANSNESGLVPDVCVLGDDLSRGRGHAADVDLLDTGGDENENGLDAPLVSLDDIDDVEGDTRSVSQTQSRTRLVPIGGNSFGLMSEVSMTIAPVTVAQDLPASDPLRLLTIEVGGEWTLRAVATGGSGSSVELLDPPGNPVVRILDAEGTEVFGIDLSDILGPGGLQLPVELQPLLDLSIGEDPRAIARPPGSQPDAESSPTETPNLAEGAIDIVRLRLLNAAVPGGVLDLRVGHMEVSAESPDGGITCPIPVTKTADPTDIFVTPREPDTSSIELTVHNVYDCDLINTVLTDEITTVEGSPNFRLLNDDPETASPDIPEGDEGLLVTDGAETLRWNLGTIPKGTTKRVTFDLRTVDTGGILEDIARAAGEFANCVGEDASGLAINGLDLTGLSIPVQVRIELPRTGADALRTVAMGGGLALAASSLGLFLRRRSRRAG
jgi:LPXTG-motif cell wall-anchored protein